jgi:hypothetical protein
MKELVATASNLFYTRNEDGAFTPSVEMMIIVSEPQYSVNMKGDEIKVVKRRETKTLRFNCTPASLGLLLQSAVDVMEEIQGQSQQPPAARMETGRDAKGGSEAK